MTDFHEIWYEHPASRGLSTCGTLVSYYHGTYSAM